MKELKTSNGIPKRIDKTQSVLRTLTTRQNLNLENVSRSITCRFTENNTRFKIMSLTRKIDLRLAEKGDIIGGMPSATYVNFKKHEFRIVYDNEKPYYVYSVIGPVPDYYIPSVINISMEDINYYFNFKFSYGLSNNSCYTEALFDDISVIRTNKGSFIILPDCTAKTNQASLYIVLGKLSNKISQRNTADKSTLDGAKDINDEINSYDLYFKKVTQFKIGLRKDEYQEIFTIKVLTVLRDAFGVSKVY